MAYSYRTKKISLGKTSSFWYSRCCGGPGNFRRSAHLKDVCFNQVITLNHFTQAVHAFFYRSSAQLTDVHWPNCQIIQYTIRCIPAVPLQRAVQMVPRITQETLAFCSFSAFYFFTAFYFTFTLTAFYYFCLLLYSALPTRRITPTQASQNIPTELFLDMAWL